MGYIYFPFTGGQGAYMGCTLSRNWCSGQKKRKGTSQVCGIWCALTISGAFSRHMPTLIFLCVLSSPVARKWIELQLVRLNRISDKSECDRTETIFLSHWKVSRCFFFSLYMCYLSFRTVPLVFRTGPFVVCPSRLNSHGVGGCFSLLAIAVRRVEDISPRIFWEDWVDGRLMAQVAQVLCEACGSNRD